MLRNVVWIAHCTLAAILVLVIGCMPSSTKTVTQTRTIYTFGDASYDSQLRQGIAPIKKGPILAKDLPPGFPGKFLEADGSYAGGHIYSSIQEAQRAILEAKEQGLISKDGDWGIYELHGNWDEYAYELRPNEYCLRKSTTVVKRVY